MKWRICNINKISKSEQQSVLSLLSESKKLRLDRVKSEAAKTRSLCAAVNLSALLKDGYRLENAVISSRADGAPFVEDCELFVSLSHSGDYVAAAVSDKPVGIDIQKIRDFDKRLIERICTERELEYVGECDTKTRFFEVWTAKEAYFKMCGGSFKDADIFDMTRKCFVEDGYFVQIVFKS